MSLEGWSEPEEPDIASRHLLLCREVLFDSNQPESPYTLRGMLTAIRMIKAFPSTTDEPVFLYVEFYGSNGQYEVWFELVRLILDNESEVIDEVEETVFGPFELNLHGNRFLHGRSYPLRRVPFSEPGLYEFRLRIAGVEDVLISERLQVEE